MIVTKSNIPSRWLSMYKAFKKNGSNYDVVQDAAMKDAYKQLDILFSGDKKAPSTKMSTGSKSRPKKEEPVVAEEKIESKEE